MKKVIQFPTNFSDEKEESEEIDLGTIKLPKQILEAKSFVDMSTGAQLMILMDVDTGDVKMIKGSAVIPVMTQSGPRGIQVEIDFPVDEELDFIENAKKCFENYEEEAEKAIEEKKKELEDQNRIISASGLPFDAKNPPPIKK